MGRDAGPRTSWVLAAAPTAGVMGVSFAVAAVPAREGCIPDPETDDRASTAPRQLIIEWITRL